MHILSLLAEGTSFSNTEDIQNAFRSFYSSLWSCSSPVPLSCFDGILLPTILDSEASDFIVSFSLDEIKSALSRMPKGKSPGPDGYPTAIYGSGP